MRLAVLVAIGCPAVVPTAAFGHERWFVPREEQPPTDWGALWSFPVQLALATGVTTILLLAASALLSAEAPAQRPAPVHVGRAALGSCHHATATIRCQSAL
jgi:hypothetical protein